jgi:pyruvate formate lyase activating enzyme
MDVARIVAFVLKDKPFFDTSGGGVTLSGGEPTMAVEFTSQVLRALKANGVHTLIETCGMFDFETFHRQLYPFLDAIYFDIKIFDAGDHKTYCGATNHTILKNFRHLFSLSRNGGVKILPRLPLVPGITDTEKNVRGIAGFLNTCEVKKATLLPYHPLWQEKNAKIGIHEPMGERPEMTAFLEKEKINACKTMFQKAGIWV